MRHTKSYIKGHPNPQFTRKDFVNLDGKWDFTFDDSNEGMKKNYINHFPAKYKINVPVSYEYPDSGIVDEKIHNIVWYKKSFNHTKTDKLTLLHFEGVDYEAMVWVNGQYIGSHVGGYSRFSFDITKQLKNGENEIVVRVYDDFDATHARGKQRWMDHNYECFYVGTTGIWKTVWLEHVSKTYLKDVRITPSFTNTNVEIEYQIEGDEVDLEVETTITFNDKLIAKGGKVATRKIFSETIDITSDNATMKIHCWHPHCPNLYDVTFNLLKNGVIIDTVKSYFGVAEFLSKGNTILLNRSPLIPKLILDQGYWKESGLTYNEEQCIKDIEVMKDIGLNGCRKHQKIECDLFYYYCDIMGYLLWQELPSAYEWKSSTIFSLSKEWLDVVKQHHNHPCIMTNVIINESWGTFAILDNKAQQEFTRGLYHLTKALEPNRFVISNDGWEHTESDLITVHNYSTSKEDLLLNYNSFDDAFGVDKRQAFTSPKAAMAFDHELPKNKPLLLSEFAGIAFKKDQANGWGYGDLVQNEEQYLARLKGQIDAIIESRVFAGYCITQLSDVQQEVNGLTDEQRNYKVSKEKLKEIISRNY